MGDDVKTELKRELRAIKERNVRVEANKAWETSRTRRGLIAFVTYLLSVLIFAMINAPNPWLTALVPAAAYALSTLTLPFLKNWWLGHIYRKH